MLTSSLPNYEARVRQLALEEGVDPELAVAVWAQESSKGTDPTMRGPTLPEGHKYAGAYGQGPWQIMSFHGAMPADFDSQTRWALRYLKKNGPRGYYGETAGGGTAAPTGMPGFPSTNDYVAQVQDRMKLARAGTPDVQPGLLSMSEQPAPLQPPPQAQERTMDETLMGDGTLQRLMADPMFLMGASVLANRGNVGRGLLGGTAAYQAMQQSNALAEQRKVQAKMLEQKQLADLREQEMQRRFMEMAAPALGAGGVGGAGAPDLGQLGALGALLGIKGAGTLVDYSNARLPYGAMTQAQQAEIEDRRARAAYEGVGMPGGAAQAGVPGMTPKAAQQFAADAPVKVIDYLLAERKSGKVSSATSTLEAVNNARRALDEGMFTGPFAETKAGLAKYLGAYTGELENTQQYIASTAELARQALQQIGGNDSNTDLLFSRATTGGDITMQAKSLDKLMQITDKKARSYLSDYNRFAERLPESERETYKVNPPPGYTARPKELPKEVTRQDVQETARAMGRTEAEVINLFRQKGVYIRD